MGRLSHKINSELYATFIGGQGKTLMQESLIFSILIRVMRKVIISISNVY